MTRKHNLIMRYIRPVCSLGIIAAVSGCGTVAHTASTPSTESPGATTAQTQETTSESSPPTEVPALTIRAEASDGDTVLITGHLSEPVPQAQSDAEPSGLSECLGTNDQRALIVKLTLEVTVESTLAADVSLSDFQTAGISTGNPLSYLMGYSTGESCAPGNEVTLRQVQPSAPSNFTIWLVLPDAVTPNEPEPTAQSLSGRYMTAMPTVSINEKPVIEQINGITPPGKLHLGGSRLLFCGEDEPALAVAGTLPKRASDRPEGPACHTRPAVE
jgi:hypothetical protein